MMYIGFKVISGYNHGDCYLPMVITSSNRKIRRWKKKKNRYNVPNLRYEWRCMKNMPTLKGLDVSPINIAYNGIYS